jgi:hypothetical protein
MVGQNQNWERSDQPKSATDGEPHVMIAVHPAKIFFTGMSILGNSSVVTLESSQNIILKIGGH